MSIGLAGWSVIFATGLVWEAIAIRMGDTATWPTASRVIREHAPKWLIATALGWLVYHLLGQ